MSLPHDSAHTHVTGQSEYIDDRPFYANELIVETVFSPHARARILSINSSRALEIPGVLGVFTAKDFHLNKWGTILKDQPFLAESEVFFVGEAVAIVAAETREAALQGKERIEVKYKLLEPILSIDDAIKKKSFIAGQRKIERGDVDGAMAQAPLKLDGKVILRGADHFYLESQACIAYPREDAQIEVHSSTQHPTEVQHVVGHALGLSSKDVVCVAKRMGGGFGGKESQGAPFAAYAALVAQRLRRPARVVLTKDDDMIMTGKRNPFENSYRVGFDPDGRILALEVSLYSDGGAYADLSTSIMERAMLHCDNAYFIPNARILGQVCRTHYHPHTAFRGFGGPKGVATIERIIEEIAHSLGKDALDIRRLNCYTDKDGRNTAPYGQVIENNCLPELFSSLEKSCEYYKRRAEIQAHNRLVGERPLGLRRGLSLTAVKFGISFTTRFLNQGNALVIIHRDGTLQVSTGATEMGQGVHSRIAQLVAEELGIARDQVRCMSTSTDKNANTSPTAASSGTDLNGAAAVLAVRKIKARLSQLAEKLFDIPESRWARHTAALGTEPEIAVIDPPVTNDPNESSGPDVIFKDGHVFHRGNPGSRLSFPALVNEAYHHRISLSDYAHYKIPGLSFDKTTGQGTAFLYYTQGVAASEVSIDMATGETKVLRTDILMDLGKPINEGLDLGQVTGGFVQGMGWVTTEKLFYNKAGALLSHSPSTYKIPSVHDTPRVFNIGLFPNPNSHKSLRGMKASGEPPLLLAISVWTAIHDALKDLPHYQSEYPDLELPATQEEVLRGLWPEKFQHWEKQKS